MDRRVEQLASDLQAQNLDEQGFSAQPNPSLGQKRPALAGDLNPASVHRHKGTKHLDLEAILADKRRGPHRKDRKVQKWTPEEDQSLRDAVGVHGAKNWKLVATLVPGRDHTQCLQRWTKCLQPGLRKGTWTPEEDNILMQCVYQQIHAHEQSGSTKPRKIQWGEVCKHIEGRTAKQCRERWVNNLDPAIYRGAWSKDEDDRMKELYKKYGASWAAIAKEMPGRTENGVKIRWKALSRTKEGMAVAAEAPKVRHGKSGRAQGASKRNDSDMEEEDEDEIDSEEEDEENDSENDADEDSGGADADDDAPHAPPLFNQFPALAASLHPSAPMFAGHAMYPAQFVTMQGQPQFLPQAYAYGAPAMYPVMAHQIISPGASQSGRSDGSQPVDETFRLLHSSASNSGLMTFSGIVPQFSGVPTMTRERTGSESDSGRSGYVDILGPRTSRKPDEQSETMSSTSSVDSKLSGFASAGGLSHKTASFNPLKTSVNSSSVASSQQAPPSLVPSMPNFHLLGPFGSSSGSIGSGMGLQSMPSASFPIAPQQTFIFNPQMLGSPAPMYPGATPGFGQPQGISIFMPTGGAVQPSFFKMSQGGQKESGNRN